MSRSGHENLPGWCVIAKPLVRDASRRAASRLRLRPCERQDLEQEIWLELLVRHGGRDRESGFRLFNGGDCAGPRRASTRAALREEVERITAALLRAWPFWRRVRPHNERRFTPALEHAVAAGSCAANRHHDLQLDLAAVLPLLPAALREPCALALRGDAPAATVDAFVAAELRAVLTTRDFHEYL